MENNLTYKEIITRIAIFRNKRNLSARELALRMGHSETYFYKVENGSIILNLPTFLEALEVLEISTYEFFYANIDNYTKDNELLTQFNNLNPDNKERIIDLMRNLK